jgi:NSS family neurotransmitter:Na+ symporter
LMNAERARFGTRLGTLLTMVGVAVGLGNVWRFPYMVGQFGGAAFVVVYLVIVLAVGVPALMAEWTLGRTTRRGPVGAFAGAGLPLGRGLGWLFFLVVTAATAYYTNVVGWVGFHAVAEAARFLGIGVPASAVLPPASGFDPRSFGLQVACTGLVILACVAVLLQGLQAGIERASRVIMPIVFVILVLLILRSVTLPGAGDGLAWYLGTISWSELTPRVTMAALGQAVFSMSLGGTFMVVYGSYLDDGEPLIGNALLTAAGDAGAGLLAGLAIFPAVFAFGASPASGPGLVFETLPGVFAAMPAGALFGALFFVCLGSAAYLSDVAAFEVLIAGLTDNTALTRRRAVWTIAGLVFVFSLAPMVNMGIFVPWDLTFGSGMQTLGAMLAVVTVGWCLERGTVLEGMLGRPGFGLRERVLVLWLRVVIPAAVLAVGLWWGLTDLTGAVEGI